MSISTAARQWLTQLIVSVRSHRRAEAGASLVEYALLVALIAAVCIIAVAYFGTQTGETFSRVSSSVQAT